MAKSVELATKAKALAEKFDEHFLELGKTLRTLQEVDLEEFRDVIQNSGIGLRKAYYLVELDRNISPLNITPSRLRKIGWTKLMLLSPKITKQNAKELLQAAEDYTVRELKAFLSGDKPEQNAHCVMLYFSPKDFEEFASELKKYGASVEGRGISNKEAAIMKLVRSKKKADATAH